MEKLINVYCDESCHLLNDGFDIMVLGCMFCEKKYVNQIHEDIKRIKQRHGLKENFEIKWIKVGPGKLDFYLSLVDYFFSSPYLQFRGVIATGKKELDHERFNQNHDEWYYKMYYFLLREVIDVQNYYHIYVDIKDTKGSGKLLKLKDVLNGSLYRFADETVRNIQLVRSHEITTLQLTDLFIGALSYLNRNYEENNTAKIAVIQRIRELTGFNLTSSTNKNESKFNLFVWHPRRA